MEFNPRYRGRIRAAYWSKTLLAIAAVLSVLILPFSFDVENAVVVAGVLVVTFFEFRVHHYFLTGDPRAPGLGFRNQSGLPRASCSTRSGSTMSTSRCRFRRNIATCSTPTKWP
ncbi:MAG: hypothetical protein WDO13_04230 [Verrucomicrobiota bacterium]